jgi:glycosyltransferase involved in cell wall biosynthesis
LINILHTIDTTGPGGAEAVFINLAEGLDKKEYNSIVAIRGKGWVYTELEKYGFKPILINAKGSFNFKYLWGLIKIARKYDIDIIQSHLFGSNVYCSLVGLILNIPVVSTFHGFVDASFKDKLLWFKYSIINLGSKKIVFVSDHLKDHFLRTTNLNKNKAVRIYNGIGTNVFKPDKKNNIRREFNLSDDDIIIGSIGNIRPAKGYDILLKASSMVIKKNPKCKFVIVGEGSGTLYDELLQLRKQLALEKHVFFLGLRADVANVLNNFDIFLLTSTSEGFSISTLEAMACGLPVIVTRSGGPEEIVIEGINGVVVNCNVKDIAKGVIQFLEDKELKKNFSRMACDYVHENFSLTGMIDQYKSVYELKKSISNKYLISI